MKLNKDQHDVLEYLRIVMLQEGLKGNFAAIEIIERALEDEEL